MNDKWTSRKSGWVEDANRLKKVYKENAILIEGALLFTISLILAYIVLVELLKFPAETVAGVGQFFADWLLFPTVIIGFWIAIKEFRQSQIKPVLNLFWTGDRAVGHEEDSFVLKTSQHNDRIYRLLLHVQNDGEVVVVWYRIAVDLPRELIGFSEKAYEFRWYLGQGDNWGDNGNMQRRQHEFKSNGQHALYPGQSVHIATLEMPVIHDTTPKQEEISYSIVTDKTRPSYKKQMIKLKLETFVEQDFPADI